MKRRCATRKCKLPALNGFRFCAGSRCAINKNHDIADLIARARKAQEEEE